MSEKSNKPVIILFGVRNSGKTTAIRLAVSKLLKKGGDIKWLEPECDLLISGHDIWGFIKYKGRRIGINSAGDDWWTTQKVEKILNGCYNCDVIVAAATGFKESSQQLNQIEEYSSNCIVQKKHKREGDEEADNERAANDIVAEVEKQIHILETP